VSEAEARAQIDTKLVRCLVGHAGGIADHARAEVGHILQISSVAACRLTPPAAFINASSGGSKASVSRWPRRWRGLHQGDIVEPGGYETDWNGSSARRAARLPAYDAHTRRSRSSAARFGPPIRRQPRRAILKVVDAQDPPLRFFLGSAGLPTTRTEYAKRLETWEKWNDVSVQAQGERPPKPAQH